uniref:GLDH1 n=1 Tax=Arundo donax TaxID=35708 RepID=A0A0A9G2Q0_ARUDO
MFIFSEPFLVVFLDFICIGNECMFNKLVSFYTLKSYFGNDSKATKSTASKIK